MKAKLRIPTKKAYAYIEVEFDGSPEEIVEAHENLTRLVEPQGGIPTKDFNQALDLYLEKGTGDTQQFLDMSDEQKRVFQEIKKSIKRKGYVKVDKVPIKENL